MNAMTALYMVLAILLLIDWRQTLVVALPGGWFEKWNPLLARLIDRFGAAGVHAWFALVCVAAAIALYLVPEYRLVMVLTGIAIELAATVNNFSLGIKP